MKTLFTGPKSVYINYAYWLFDIVLMVIIIYVGASGKMAGGPPKGGSYIMGLAVLSLAPKIIVRAAKSFIAIHMKYPFAGRIFIKFVTTI